MQNAFQSMGVNTRRCETELDGHGAIPGGPTGTDPARLLLNRTIWQRLLKLCDRGLAMATGQREDFEVL